MSNTVSTLSTQRLPWHFADQARERLSGKHLGTTGGVIPLTDSSLKLGDGVMVRGGYPEQPLFANPRISQAFLPKWRRELESMQSSKREGASVNTTTILPNNGCGCVAVGSVQSTLLCCLPWETHRLSPQHRQDHSRSQDAIIYAGCQGRGCQT